MWLRSSERFLVSSRPCCSVKSSVSFRPHRNRVADSCNTVFVLFCHTCVWQCIAVINALCTRALCGMSLIIRGGRDSPGGHEFHVPPAEPGVKQRSIFCWCCLIWEDSVAAPIPGTGRLGFFLRGMDLYDKFADEIIIFRTLTYFCGDSQRRPGRVPVGMTAAAAS